LRDFRPRNFWHIPEQANTRSFKEIVENEEENIALFSGGVDVVPYRDGAGREDAAADVLV
jgi:coproporphyrinogen III oxidase